MKKLPRIDTRVTKNIDTYGLDGKLTDTIAFLQGELDAIPRQYRESAGFNLSSYVEYDSAVVDITIYYFRPETDEEYEVRAALHLRCVKSQEASERAQYERLKAKFED